MFYQHIVVVHLLGRGGEGAGNILSYKTIFLSLPCGWVKCGPVVKQELLVKVHEEGKTDRWRASFLLFPYPFLLLLAWDVARKAGAPAAIWDHKSITEMGVTCLGRLGKSIERAWFLMTDQGAAT